SFFSQPGACHPSSSFIGGLWCRPIGISAVSSSLGRRSLFFSASADWSASGWSSAAWLSTSGLEASGLEASYLSALESESFGSDIAKDGFGSALLWPLGSDMAKDGFSDFGWSSAESSSVQSPACCPKLKPISGSSLDVCEESISASESLVALAADSSIAQRRSRA